MNLTIDEALQAGVEAHKAGKTQEADRLYTAILKAQPSHPDANHNMGVLAVGVGQVDTALPFFKSAIQARPSTVQFWLSYINALISLDRLSDAEAVFKQAKDRGVEGKEFNELGERLSKLSENLNEHALDSEAGQKQLSILDNLTHDQAIKLAGKKAKKGLIEDARVLYKDILDKLPHSKKAKSGLRSLAGSTTAKARHVKHPSQNQLQVLISLHSRGQFKEALEGAEQLLRQFPDSVMLHNICGVALGDLKQHEAAIRSYEKAIKKKPDFAQAHNNMGNSLKELGDLDAAIDSYKRAIKINPGYAEAYNNMGNALKGKGDLDTALNSYKQAIKHKPNYAEAYNNMGNSLKAKGDLEAALDSYKKALKIKPNFAQVYNNIGNCLKEKGELEGALESYDQALKINPSYDAAYSNMGNTLRLLGDIESAVDRYKQAIKINPDYAEAYNNLGIALTEKGELEAAISYYKKAIKINPSQAEVYRHLSSLISWSSDDEYLLQMQKLARSTTITDDARCHLSFALGKAYEDLREFEKAFHYFSQGNALRKKILGYNISQDMCLFKQLKDTQPLLSDNALSHELTTGNPTPIFILGMPRSGTTLVEQIISAHSDVTGAGELTGIGYFGGELAHGRDEISPESLVRFRQQYLLELKKKYQGARFVTDKMPHNFRYIPLICAAFPEARIIHVHRDPAATCWSNYKYYFQTQDLGYCYDLEDIVTYYNLYLDLMRAWIAAYQDRIYYLDYENLTINQDAETRALIKNLGLGWEDGCLDPQNNSRSVSTASNQQIRKKVYRNSSNAWRQYESLLNGVFDRLEESELVYTDFDN